MTCLYIIYITYRVHVHIYIYTCGILHITGLLSDDGEALLLTCARKLAQNHTRFFLVTDDITARARVTEALKPNSVCVVTCTPYEVCVVTCTSYEYVFMCVRT